MIKEILIPSPGESVTEVTLAAWLRANGEVVRKGDELFEIESDKATLAVSADVSGALEILIQQGETVRVGAVAARINTEVAGAVPAAVASPVVTESGAATAPSAAEPASYTKGLPSVAARKLMEERGILPDQIAGSGKGGRITKTDVLTFESKPLSDAATTESISRTGILGEVEPSPVARGERRHKLSALRMKVAERLVAVKNQTAMLTTFNEVDMTAILTARTRYKEKFKETYSVGLGFMSFFVRAVCVALEEYPAINAFVEGDEVVYHDFVDMGIAVSAPKGLVVPVIRHADRLSFNRIESEIESLAARARNNQLTLDEMTGGTFTISNGGVFGSLLSTPILNPPQSGILGMHNIVRRPIAVGDQIEIRPMMYLAFSYDHRIIDGRESVGFLVRVKELLEDPMRLLLKV